MTPNEASFCEAAMCLWEQVLTLIDQTEEWEDHVGGVGYNQLRSDVMEWAPLCHNDYEQVMATFDNSFDWDFVPRWIDANVIINDTTFALRPDRVIPGLS